MPKIPYYPELKPRTPGPLKVLMQTRISTDKQDEASLADQEQLLRNWVTDRYDGPTDIRVHSEQDSGENITRPGFLRLIETIETWRPDLMLSEDGSRVCRSAQLPIFAGTCIDAGTRFITVDGDGIDTAKDDWRVRAGFAGLHHALSNDDTSRRIKRTLDNRFDNGEIVQQVIYGYRKPHAGCSAAEIEVLPEARAVADRIFSTLEEGGTYAEVARWLEAEGIAPGEWVRSGKWTGPLVREWVMNPMINGFRRRGDRKAIKVEGTGQRKSVKAEPERLRLDEQPHLTLIDPDRWERTTKEMKRRYAHLGRKRSANAPAVPIPRRSRFPGGGLLRCGVCGEPYVWGGHGRSERLMCRGYRAKTCRNGTTVNGERVAKDVLSSVIDRLSRLESWPDELARRVAAEADEAANRHDSRRRDLEKRISRIDRELGNLVRFIRDGKESVVLRDELDTLEQQKQALECKLDQLPPRPDRTVMLPPLEELTERARELVSDLRLDDPAWGRRLRHAIPTLCVLPVRLPGVKTPKPRIEVAVDFAALADAPWLRESRLLEVDRFTVDCFPPPNYVRILRDAVRLWEAGVKLRDIATQLKTFPATVSRAMAVHRRMVREGSTDPFVLAFERDDGCQSDLRCA